MLNSNKMVVQLFFYKNKYLGPILKCFEDSTAVTRRLITFEISSVDRFEIAVFDTLAINADLHQSKVSPGSCRQLYNGSDCSLIGPK